MLPLCDDDLAVASEFVRDKPSGLMCVEHNVDDCHRGPLSRALATLSGLDPVHL